MEVSWFFVKAKLKGKILTKNKKNVLREKKKEKKSGKNSTLKFFLFPKNEEKKIVFRINKGCYRHIFEILVEILSIRNSSFKCIKKMT